MKPRPCRPRVRPTQVLTDALDLASEQACTFALLWELRSADLSDAMR